jgi:HSP20 family protein
MGAKLMSTFFDDMMRQMEQDLRRSDDALRCFLQSAAGPSRFWEPLVDIDETREAIRVKVELAGVRTEDIHVEISGDGRILTVRGVRRDIQEDTGDRTAFHQMEVYFGPFERNISLPARPEVDRDNVQASYRDGFLIVLLPKVAVARPRTTSVPVTE